MEKINVAELLKDCPKGMKLDCTMFEGIEFDSIVDNDYFPIRCRIKNSNDEYNFYNLTKYGYWNNDYKAKCVIFPQGKTTWERFVPPCKFKNGDIVASNDGSFIGIVKYADGDCIYTYCAISKVGHLTKNFPYYLHRFAFEKEKEKLFRAIKNNGYKWNSETKTLEKLIKPTFKVGDRIRHKNSGLCCTLGEYSEGISAYRTDIGLSITYKELEQWELAPNKFDITTLKPFDKVLVRDCNTDKWNIDFFAYYREDKGDYQCMTFTKNQCIPYESNKYLMGTTDSCNEYFKTWK